MKRYFIVGSSGRPTEVNRREYYSQLNKPYLTAYTVGEDGESVLDKQTEESEHEPFPNCS